MHEPSTVTTTPYNARILLAEDHPANQRLTAYILQSDAHVVDAVSSGRQALEAFIQQPYDLILMDVYMPEMDGLAATASIREHESRYGGRIPIIGLTGGDMYEDRERCLQVGMDDYLSKPFRADSLRAHVARWARTPTLDLEAVADLHGLLRAGAATAGEPITRFVQQFLDRLPGQVAAMRWAYEQGDHAALYRNAHDLKSAGGTFGVPRITYLCAHLESLATAEGWVAVPAWLAELELTCGRILRQFDL